jgi:restriction system protein
LRLRPGKTEALVPVPQPQTREFRAFLTNIEYARKMILAGRSLAAFQSPVIDIGDFYRAAWVQAVSAIDHWFHEELYRRVSELAAEDSPGMPHQLTRFELPLSLVEEVRRGSTTLADAVCGHVKTKWSNAALQNPRKISEALKLVTEEDIWAKAAVQLNEWNHGRTAMTAQTLKQQYLSITDRRNRIAHDADLLDGDLKQRRPITDADVSDAIDWIERIASAIAQVLG